MRVLLGCLVLLCSCGYFVYSQPAVPVVNPKKKEKATNTKIPSEDEKDEKEETTDDVQNSLIPNEFIKNRVTQLAPGKSVFIGVGIVKVDVKRRCWLNPNGITGAKNEERLVEIRKDDNGFHLVLDSNLQHQWTAEDTLPAQVSWISIKSIRVKTSK